MFNQFTISCRVIAGIAIAIMASTGYAGPTQSAGAPPMALTQSSLKAGSSVSSQDSSFVPGSDRANNALVYGKTYGEWSAEWWKWALTFPKGENPVADETGEFCDSGQSGPVWFLAGTLAGADIPVTRNCTIPAGKALFYPVINSVWYDGPGDEVLTDDEVRWIMGSFSGGGDLACRISSTLDTYSTPNLAGYLEDPLFPAESPAPVSARLRPIVRTQSPKFTFNLPLDNILDAPMGENARLISEGFWVMLPPLTPGKHVLTIYGAACGDLGDGLLEKYFETAVTYNLTVVRRNRPKFNR